MDEDPRYPNLDQPVQYHLLRYTIDMLKQKCSQFLTAHEKLANEDDAIESKVLDGKLRFFEKQINSLDMAEREIDLIRQVLKAGDTLETAISVSQLRLNRLKEEHEWLKNEAQHFEVKKQEEQMRCEDLRQQIAHVAFIFNHRREWNGNSLPTELYGLPRAEEQRPSSSLLKDTSRETHETIELKPLLRTIAGGEMDGVSREIPLMGDGDKYDDLPLNLSDKNTSNSGTLTLTELKNLMLMEKHGKSKRPKIIRKISRSKPFAKSKGKSKLVTSLDLDEHQKLAITEYLRDKIPSIYGNPQCQEGEGFSHLDVIIENFVRSSKRSENMNALIQLINNFIQRDNGTAGLNLCWMAVTTLQAYEKDLRKSTHGDHHSSTMSFHLPSKQKEVTTKTEHKKVIEDTSRLLTLLGQHYKARTEFGMSIKCFKEILKLRRETNSLMTIGTANTLYQLSIVQALAHCQSASISSARKAVKLRKQLLESEPLMLDSTVEQLAVARDSTHLALLLMRKQQLEQKRLRYRQLPPKTNEVPILLTRATSTIMSLSQVYANAMIFVVGDWDNGMTDPAPSTLGDSRDAYCLNPMNECLFVAQNALSIYYILCKKWTKAVRLLQSNLKQIDEHLPDSNLEHLPKSRRLVAMTIKLTCLKSLLYVLCMTEPNTKHTILLNRIQSLDRFFRNGDELNESDMIRMCQSCLLGLS